MNKWFIFAGFILAFVLLFYFNSGKISTNDIFKVMNDKSGIPNEIPNEINYYSPDYPDGFFFQKVYQKKSDISSFSSYAYGAILPPQISKAFYLKDFFEVLKKNQNVDTFMIIGKNHSTTGNFKIALTDYGFKTPYGNLNPDQDFLKKLIKDLNDPDIGIDNSVFENESSINVFMPFIAKTFPDAKIFTILLEDSANKEDLKNLADNLFSLKSDNVFVIASTLFSEKMPYNVTLFHDELSKNAIESFDIESLDNLDVENKNSLYVLLNYLEKLNAKKVEIQNYTPQYNLSTFIITFHEGEIKADKNLDILAFGDMMLGRYVRVLMDQYGKDYIFENIKGYNNKFFDGADVVFGNLEGPIHGQGTSGGTSMVFSFNEDIVPLLKEYGFDVVSIANNHALDQGWDGRATTISALDSASLGWCGHPREADYDSVYYEKVKDSSYAFVCFHDVTYKLNDEAAINLIKEIRPNVDFLIVSIHWGYEYQHKADYETEISPGHAFIDAGADFVIGHHPHVVQNFEIYNGKFIFYSLGNFIFDQYWSTDTQKELAIGIVLGESNTKVYLFPMKSELSKSSLINDDEWDSWSEEFIDYGDYNEDLKEQIRNGIIEINNL